MSVKKERTVMSSASTSDSTRYARFGAASAVRKLLLLGVVATTFLMMSLGRTALALPILPLQVSTNPGNGDQNPYGVVFVPPGFPDNTVQLGDVLVANFNDT